MSKLLIAKIFLYFLIAFLAVMAQGIDGNLQPWQWAKLTSGAIGAGLVAIRAFFDRSVSAELGAIAEAGKPQPPSA